MTEVEENENSIKSAKQNVFMSNGSAVQISFDENENETVKEVNSKNGTEEPSEDDIVIQNEARPEIRKAHILIRLYDIIMACISMCVITYQLDRKACGLILLTTYVFTCYSLVAYSHRMITWQSDVAEIACGFSVVSLFLVLTYFYGAFFGIFSVDLQDYLDESCMTPSHESHESSSVLTEKVQTDSCCSEKLGVDEMNNIIKDISMKNTQRIEWVVSKNQERLTLLAETNDAKRKLGAAADEELHEKFTSEIDKYIKISTCEIEEHLKLQSALIAERVKMSTAVDEESFKSEVAKCLHDIMSAASRDIQKIKLFAASEYTNLQSETIARYSNIASKLARLSNCSSSTLKRSESTIDTFCENMRNLPENKLNINVAHVLSEPLN